MEDLNDEQMRKVVESEASEMREPAWARTLLAGLTVLGRREIEMETSRKGADWKVALARYLRGANGVSPIFFVFIFTV